MLYPDFVIIYFTKIELEHAFTQFCFECQPLRSNGRGDVLDLYSNPWDFPYAYYDKMKTLQNKTSKHQNNDQRSDTDQSG